MKTQTVVIIIVLALVGLYIYKQIAAQNVATATALAAANQASDTGDEAEGYLSLGSALLDSF